MDRNENKTVENQDEKNENFLNDLKTENLYENGLKKENLDKLNNLPKFSNGDFILE